MPRLNDAKIESKKIKTNMTLSNYRVERATALLAESHQTYAHALRAREDAEAAVRAAEATVRRAERHLAAAHKMYAGRKQGIETRKARYGDVTK